MTTETTLDERVAVALGFLLGTDEQGTVIIDRMFHRPLPQFSSTWAGAGMVIEAMRERGYGVDFTYQEQDYPEDVADTIRLLFRNRLGHEGYYSGSAKPQAAVCLAALAALEGEE